MTTGFAKYLLHQLILNTDSRIVENIISITLRYNYDILDCILSIKPKM